jgi:hypothetical protein
VVENHDPRIVKRLSVKELQRELSTRQLTPLKSDRNLTSQTQNHVQIKEVVSREESLRNISTGNVRQDEYDRLKALYDDVKSENDKKKEYIQELAKKYQNIIEDLKNQIATSNSSDTSAKENLKLRTVIKKMDEEITILKQNQNNDSELKNQALELESDSLRSQIEILTNKNRKLEDQLRNARNARPEIEENLRLDLEFSIKESLSRDFKTKEEILKKQLESVGIQKNSLEGENARLKTEFERLLCELKKNRDADRGWDLERDGFESEIEQLKIKIKT